MGSTDETSRQILDSIRGDGADEILREMESWTIEEKTQAARKAVYGIVEPHLLNGEPCSPETVAEVEALFEGVFKSVEASSLRTRSSSRS